MFRNDIDAAMERARIAEEELRRLEAKDEKSQEELDALRGTLAAQRAEIEKLRKLAPRPEPGKRPATGLPIALLAGVAISVVAAGATVLFTMRSSPPRSQRVVLVGPQQTGQRARPPAPAPTAEVSPPLAEEIGDEAMAALLMAKRWRSDWLKGELRFVQGESGLEGRLASGGSERSVAVKLGKLATLELRVSSAASGITERLTFFGAVSRDRMTIRGTVDKVLVEGANQHAEQGVFTLSAVR